MHPVYQALLLSFHRAHEELMQEFKALPTIYHEHVDLARIVSDADSLLRWWEIAASNFQKLRAPCLRCLMIIAVTLNGP